MKKHESKQKVVLRETTLGSGKLALILPLVPKTPEDVPSMAAEAISYKPDILEWRIDYFDAVLDFAAVKEAAQTLRSCIGNTALMVTPRHIEENGVRSIEPEDKKALLRLLIESGLVDMVDVELRYGKEYISEIKSLCESNHCALMVSYHDLNRTPDKEEVFEKLLAEVDVGADVCKVSFVCQSYGDIDRLGHYIAEAKETLVQVPIVSVSASPMGTVSRIAGDVFGSDGTFVSCGKTHQIHIEDLRALRKSLDLDT